MFNCVHFAIVHVFMNYLSFCIELCFVFLLCILYYLNLKSSILCFLLFFIIMKYGSLAMIIMNIAYIFLLRDTHYIKIDQSSHCFIILCWKINVHSFKHKLIMNPLISISFENDCYWRCCCLLQRRAGNIYVVVYCYVYYCHYH